MKKCFLFEKIVIIGDRFQVRFIVRSNDLYELGNLRYPRTTKNFLARYCALRTRKMSQNRTLKIHTNTKFCLLVPIHFSSFGKFCFKFEPRLPLFPLGCVSTLNHVERSYSNVSKTNTCFVLLVIACIVFGGSQKSRLFVVSDVLHTRPTDQKSLPEVHGNGGTEFS